MRIFKRPRQSESDKRLLAYIRSVFPGAELVTPESCGCSLCLEYINKRKETA